MPFYLTSIKTVSYFFLRLAGRFGSTSSVTTASASATTGASAGASSTTGLATSSTASGAATGRLSVESLFVTIHCGSVETLASGAVSTPLTFPRFLVQLLFLYLVSKQQYLR